MKIAVIGYATDGRAGYEYFMRHGHEVTICDQNAELALPAGALSQLGVDYLHDLNRFDLILRSSGVPPRVILEKNPGVKPKITTAVNEFLRACPTKNTIGVTGTKGKGTTSTLITKMLEATGHKTFLGGNIGNSPLEFIDEVGPDDFVVLELSSFQLSDLTYSPHTAVCLMVVPEHLDWHDDMADYVGAKAHLFEHQNSDDVAIYFANSDRSKSIAGHGPAKKLPYYTEPGAHIVGEDVVIDGTTLCKLDELKLLGNHNWQNVCAALTTVWQFSQDDATLRAVLTTFSGLPHRIEFVRKVDGIKYYNDSFASGVHATGAAVKAVPEKQVLIVGGYDRMLPLDYFVNLVEEEADRIRTVLVIGASAGRLIEALQAAGFSNFVHSDAKTMSEVVAAARQQAKSGDAILLSPGFASFDMFKNFEDRGLQFRAVVNSL